MSGAPSLDRATTVHDLHQSLMSTHRSARERVQMMQAFEQRHRQTPLADLAALRLTKGPARDVRQGLPR